MPGSTKFVKQTLVHFQKHWEIISRDSLRKQIRMGTVITQTEVPCRIEPTAVLLLDTVSLPQKPFLLMGLGAAGGGGPGGRSEGAEGRH